MRCFCCGKEGELSTDYPLKDKILRKDWYNKSGNKYYAANKVNFQVGTGSEVQGLKVGFVGMQITKGEKIEPDILLYFGSTLSLFKD